MSDSGITELGGDCGGDTRNEPPASQHTPSQQRPGSARYPGYEVGVPVEPPVKPTFGTMHT